MSFQNIKEHILRYDNSENGEKYNTAYRRVLLGRADGVSLVDENGNITEQSIRLIEYGLREFDMERGGAMNINIQGVTFRNRLTNKLHSDNIRMILIRLRNLRIETGEWQNYREDVKTLYQTLSEDGENSLHTQEKRFDVGTTKILNFIFSELFVMLDRNVAKNLINRRLIRFVRKGSTYQFSFEKYWEVMSLCYNQLEEYRNRYGNIQQLLEYDEPPTTLTRIFDKYNFVPED